MKKNLAMPILQSLFLFTVILLAGCAGLKPLITIHYPEKVEISDKIYPYPYYNGWITGINKDKGRIFLKGSLPLYGLNYKSPHIKAQAGNGPIVIFVAVKGAGEFEGRAVFEGYLPVISGGMQKVTMKSLDDGGNLLAYGEFDIYAVGFGSPADEAGYLPDMAFAEFASEGRVTEPVYDESGRRTILDHVYKDNGGLPVLGRYSAKPGVKITVGYGDRTVCNDFDFGFGSGGEFTKLDDWTVPADGNFCLRLKPVYKGKSFIGACGWTKTESLNGWKIYAAGTWEPKEWKQIGDGRQGYSEVSCNYLGYMNASDSRLTGAHAMKMELSEGHFGYKDREVDITRFNIGYTCGGNDDETIEDVYRWFTVFVPAKKAKKPVRMAVYSDDANPPLIKGGYAPVTPVYEVVPGLYRDNLSNEKNDIKISFYISNYHLQKDGRQLSRDGLVICREYRGKGAYKREIIPSKWEKNFLTAMVNEAGGYYYIINKDALN